MILVYLDSGKLPEGFKGGEKKRVRKFSLWANGENKNIFVLWRLLRKEGLASSGICTRGISTLGKMVIINDLGNPREWTMLEKYDLQWPSHCQLIGQKIVLEKDLYLWIFAYRSFLLWL